MDHGKEGNAAIHTSEALEETMAWIARELNAGVPQTLWRALWAKREKSDNTRD
jgi:hypothetical protein